MPFRLKRCRVSKSEDPSLSTRFVLSCSDPFALAPVLSYEFVSVDFDSVYDALNCSPRARRLFAVTQRPSYHDFPMEEKSVMLPRDAPGAMGLSAARRG